MKEIRMDWETYQRELDHMEIMVMSRTCDILSDYISSDRSPDVKKHFEKTLLGFTSASKVLDAIDTIYDASSSTSSQDSPAS